YRGLSVQLRGGERSLFDGSLRYAGTTLNDRLAFKINATHFQADDWEADSDDVHFTSQNPGGSPAGYDAVNVYGDIELDFPGDPQFAAIPADLRDAMGVVYMPGYREVDLIHDNTARNTRLNGSVHYLLNDRLKASYEYRFATGSATYQSTSRYRFEDFRLNTHRAELTGDDFMLRAYTIGDDSGDTYDLNFTGVNMNVPLVQQYVQNYATAFGAALQGGQTQDEAHQFARNQISGIILVPGTDEFENARDEVRSNPDNVIGGGSGFAVSSRINHAEGQYNLALGGVADVIAGASYRQYYLNSDGTLFNDEPGDESIFNYEYGFYGQAGRSFLDDKLNLLAAGRYDDFQNFDSKFSPRLSAVYSLGDSRQHNIRLSWQNAFRSPTQLDQYIDLDLGPLVLYGNIGDGFDGFTIPSVQAFSASVASGSPDPTLLEQISLNPLEVEQVRTFEAGYKGLFGDLYADVSVYFSRYEDFIGAVRFYGNEDGSLPDLSTGQGRATQVWTNATQTVSSSGLSLGLNYYYSSPLRFSATYTYSHLDMEDVDDDIIPAFNTPEHKYSLGLHGQPLNQLNYSFNYRWVQEHDYEMPFAEGVVPTYWVIDAQANYRFPDYNTTVKIGGQNLTNHRHIQTYAAPTIGRMVYLSFIYEM
ncbi:MAG: TonB-dependent receptor, partial [Balneolales bacterium]